MRKRDSSRCSPSSTTAAEALPACRAGTVEPVSDVPFIGVEELERMSPDERLEALRDRVVTDLDDLPDDFRRRVIATAESL